MEALQELGGALWLLDLQNNDLAPDEADALRAAADRDGAARVLLS